MGPYQGPSDIRWTAPQSGLIDLQSSAENVQSCCGTRAVNYDVVFDNNAPAFSQNLPGLPAQPADPTALGAFPTATFDGLFYVTKGETINFLAYNGGGGDNNTMQLNADIGYVPEPTRLLPCAGSVRQASCWRCAAAAANSLAQGKSSHRRLRKEPRSEVSDW